MDAALARLSARVGQALTARGWRLACAESCTGGWAAQVVTHTPGSSAWFERGFVTYSDAAKIELLDVREKTLETFGAVSPEAAQEMAASALKHAHADIAVAITGIAGPDGASPDKPVGLVCFAWVQRTRPPQTETRHFQGSREAIRQQAVVHALAGVLSRAAAAAG